MSPRSSLADDHVYGSPSSRDERCSSGSIPSFYSISSAISLPSLCQPAADGRTTNEAGVSKHTSYGSLECKTPGQKGTPRTCKDPHIWNLFIFLFVHLDLDDLAAHDITLSSDADSVSEVELYEVSINHKPFKFPGSMFNLGFDLSSSEREDAVGLHPNSGLDDVDEAHWQHQVRGRGSGHDSRIGRHFLLALCSFLLCDAMTDDSEHS